LISCNKEEEVDIIDSTEIQLRDDHCFCGIGSYIDGNCHLDFFITPDPCPTGGTWEVTLDGAPMTPTSNIPNGVTVDNSIDGTYCATYTIGECCVTRCIKIKECVYNPCDPCEECTVSLTEENCTLTADISEGCTGNVQTNFTYNGIPIGSSPDGTLDIDLDGEYCVEIVDENDCMVTDCTFVEGCDQCDSCNLVLIQEEGEGCTITACTEGRNCRGPFYYLIDGPFGYNDSASTNGFINCVFFNIRVNGEYCVTMYDSAGCKQLKCITIDCIPQ